MKTEEELNQLYDDCLNFWGEEEQLKVVQEECAELIVAISHYLRNRKGSRDNVIEELADVKLITDQMIRHFGEHEVMNVFDAKSDRTAKKLEKYKEKD